MMRTLVGMALVGAVLGSTPDNAVAQNSESRRLNVLGRATIETVPDFATVEVGVSTKAETPTAALDENSAIARRVIAFSMRFGVEPREIQTTSVRLSQNVTYTPMAGGGSRRETDGYAASNTVRVRIRSLSRLGEYIRDVLGTGANDISNAQFGLSNIEQISDDARAAAVDDATRKAKRLAEAAGVKLGPVQQINHPPRAEYRTPDGQADLPRRLPPIGNVPVEIGTLDISTEVDVSCAIE